MSTSYFHLWKILEKLRLSNDDGADGFSGFLTGRVAVAAWSAWNSRLSCSKAGASAVIKNAFVDNLCYNLHRTTQYVLTQANVPSQCRRARGREDPSQLLIMLNTYPSLAQLWENQVRGWIAFAKEFVAAASAFGKSHGFDLNSVELRTGLSDPHRNGRSVVRVKVRDGIEWYYKPRDGGHEAGWSQIVEALNLAGFRPLLRAARVHNRRTHVWMEGITPLSWDGQERQRFDERVGATLYLAHILKAVDLHPANFVSAGEYPVLIDCECFFHPETKLPVGAASEPEASLLRTGMFVPSNAAWPLGVGPSRLMERRKAVARGFEAMHEWLGSRTGKRTLERGLKQWRRGLVRHIYRPTVHYMSVLSNSLKPALLRAPCARNRFLRSSLDDRLCSQHTVRQEVSQLSAGDIPIFYGRAASRRVSLTAAEFSHAIAELLYR